MTIASQNESTLDQTIGDGTRGGTEEKNGDRGKKIEDRRSRIEDRGSREIAP
jgi:hypothetical protein